MADERARLSAPRVVVLSPESLRAAMADLLPAIECVSVASPYEAAAEILAAPAMAVVIDLRLMAPRHLRLLQIARERGAELLAVGGLPAGLTGEDLSGVRLMARADLKAALGAILKAREGRYEPAGPPESKRAAHVPDRPDARATSRSEIPVMARREESEPPRPEAQAPPPKAASPRRQASPPSAQEPPPKPNPQAQDPRGILSADEMAALLEDEP